MQQALVIFQGKNIRRVWDKNEWHFSVVDVIRALTESPDPYDYWYQLKKRESANGAELSTLCRLLKFKSSDGKQYLTECASTSALLRIIQAIPSRKAEPFKQWLAAVGYERIKEIENPALAQKRMRDTYKSKGYSDAWIEKRIRGAAIRDELTDSWKKHGVKEGKDFAILTSEISKATFGMTPQQHKQLKGLKGEPLRDHMNDLELVFTMLGEAATSTLTTAQNPRGFMQNKRTARAGGSVAGVARKSLESMSRKRVASGENYLEQGKQEAQQITNT